MGYYINQNSKGEALDPQEKAKQLIADGAEVTDATFKENLVCVVKNGMFDAAGYCFNEQEMKAFQDPSDYRPKTWLIVPNAKELSGYDRD